MRTFIPYGNSSKSTELPERHSTLLVKEPHSYISEEQFKDKIRNFLKANQHDLSDTLIVVADKTRLCGYPTHLPLLIQILKDHGLHNANLRFIIAYGTHPPQSEDECLQGYGEIYKQYPFIHHDCDAADTFVDCGLTSRGVPIRHRRDIFEASCVITMGPICHHYFAGYGGGRKLIFPGCGQRAAIYRNHSLYLDNENQRLSVDCQPGILADNPIAEDLFEIEDKRCADIAIHGIMDSKGSLSDILIGSGRQKFLEGCSAHGMLCESRSATFPLVIASCGGYPKDINFIQSHKAIHNASMFVEEGGTLIMYCECRDGIGSKTFLPWFELESFTDAFNQLAESYEGNGGTALAMMTKTQRIKIIMVTQLDEQLCQKIGVQKWSHSQVCEHLQKENCPIAYIPNASLLVRKIA